jgi:N12 class adenine-specific DNA methylase
MQYKKKFKMNEKLKTEDHVLLTKDQDGSLKPVTGLDEKGNVKTVNPKQATENDFIKVDKNADLLENFFKNFLNQAKNPTHTGFYAMAVGTYYKLFGNENKVSNEKDLEQYRVNPQDFTKQNQEQYTEFKERLADKYNRTFNCFVRPEYNGSHQEFPNLDLKGLGISDLYKSQKDAIWMDKLNGGGIVDHEVGGSKTLIMCVSAYEKKRLGLVNKPVITALKANVHEIAQTFCTAYPYAKVLYPGKEDFTPAKRMRIFNEMKNNNWDAIILTHEQFGVIPQSPEIQQQILQAELDTVEENLEVLRSQGKEVSRAMEKGMIKRQQNLEAKLSLLSILLL